MFAGGRESCNEQLLQVAQSQGLHLPSPHSARSVSTSHCLGCVAVKNLGVIFSHIPTGSLGFAFVWDARSWAVWQYLILVTISDLSCFHHPPTLDSWKPPSQFRDLWGASYGPGTIGFNTVKPCSPLRVVKAIVFPPSYGRESGGSGTW